MGGSLSAKYENINHDFDIGVWKVHDAISKSSGKHVSLWIIDYQLMKQRDRNKKIRRKYLQHCQNAIQIQQKISHRNILKILEYDSAGKKFGFASEKVVCSLSKDTKYSRDEAMYITQQLAITLDYLHENHKLVFLGLCPDNVFLSPSFTLKLGLFLHTTPYQSENAPIQHPFMPWQPNSIYFVPANYCAPEIVNGSQPITVNADTYMFALLILFIFTGRQPSNATGASDLDASLPLAACKDLPEEYSSLLKSCLNIVPASRPSFQSIVNDEAFSSIVCIIFKYLENISTKEPRDLFTFFSWLKSYINVFSFRIIRQKVMPIFIYFIKKDVRYGIALLPMVLKIHNKFDDKQFLEEIVTPLRPIFSITEPTTIPGIFVDHLAIFINRLPPQKYEEFVYPIILNALKVNSKAVVEKVLKVLPYIVSLMPTDMLKTELVPTMKKVIENLISPDDANSFIEIIILTMKKTGSVFIAEEAIPSIINLWSRTKYEQIAEKVADLLTLMVVPVDILISTSIPTAISILSNSKVSTFTQARLLEFVRKSLLLVQNERPISNEEIKAVSSYKIPEIEFPTEPLIYKDSDDDDNYEGEEEEEEYKGNENYSDDENEANVETQELKETDENVEFTDDGYDSSKNMKNRSKSFDPKKQQQLMEEEIKPSMRNRRKTTGALPVISNNSPSSNTNSNNSNNNSSNRISGFPSTNLENYSNPFNDNNFQPQQQNQPRQSQQLPQFQRNNTNNQFDMRRFSMVEKPRQLNVPPIAFPKNTNASSGDEFEESQQSSSNQIPNSIPNRRPKNNAFAQTQPIKTSQPFLPQIDLNSVNSKIQKQSPQSPCMNQSRSQSQFNIHSLHDDSHQQTQQDQSKFVSQQRKTTTNFSDASPTNSPRGTSSSGHNPFVQLNFSQITDANLNQQHAFTARCSAQNPFHRNNSSKSNQSNESSSSTAISLSQNDLNSPRKSVIFDQNANMIDPFSQQFPPPSKHNPNQHPQQQQTQKQQQSPINLDMNDPFAAALNQRQNNPPSSNQPPTNPSSDQFEIFNQNKNLRNPFDSSASKSNPFNTSGNNSQRQLNSPFSTKIKSNDGFEFEFDQ